MCMAEKSNLRLQKAVWQCTQPADAAADGHLQHTLEVCGLQFSDTSINAETLMSKIAFCNGIVLLCRRFSPV